MVRVHLTPPVFKRSPVHPCRMAGGFFIPQRTKNSHPKNSLFVYPLFFQTRASRLSLASRVCPARRCPRRRLPLDGKTKKCNNLLVKKTTKTVTALPAVFPPSDGLPVRRPKTALSQNRNETGPQGACSFALSRPSSLESSRSFRGRAVKNSAFSSMVDLGCWKTSFPGFTGSSMAYR